MLLNLVVTHRYDGVQVQLKAVAHSFAVGNKLRLAITTTYWPFIWPSPERVTLTLYECSSLSLQLPVLVSNLNEGKSESVSQTCVCITLVFVLTCVCAVCVCNYLTVHSFIHSFVCLFVCLFEGEAREFGPPEAAKGITSEQLTPSLYERTSWTQSSPAGGDGAEMITCTCVEDSGVYRVKELDGLTMRHRTTEVHTLRVPNDPLSVVAETEEVRLMERAGPTESPQQWWKAEVQMKTRITCDALFFHVEATIMAWLQEETIYQRHFTRKVERLWV